MVSVEDFGNFETAWCPGCGNFGIRNAMKKAFAELDLAPRRIALACGIGQAAKGPHYIRCNLINGLHGRSIPMATAIKAANRELTVIAQSGDGCHYAEGGNHFLHAIRRNPDITVLVHDNQVYGLTKGQASPTSRRGFSSKAQPLGTPSEPFNPIAAAVAMRAGFVARSFAGNLDHLADMLKQAINHKGLSIVDVLQPCVSMNKINTWQFYNERVKAIDGEHDPGDWEAAMRVSREWGDEIPMGVIYREERPLFEDVFPALSKGPLAGQAPDPRVLENIMESFA